MLTKAELKLAAYLLDLASEEFGNHGCNDLDLVKEAGLDPEDSFVLRKDLTAYSGDEVVEEEHNHHTLDAVMMEYLAHRMKAESEAF